MSATFETNGEAEKEWICFHLVWTTICLHPCVSSHFQPAMCSAGCFVYKDGWRWLQEANNFKSQRERKKKSPTCIQEGKVTYKRTEWNLTLSECSFRILNMGDNGAGHRSGAAWPRLSPCVSSLQGNEKARSHRCFWRKILEHILHSKTWVQLGNELVLETEYLPDTVIISKTKAN